LLIFSALPFNLRAQSNKISLNLTNATVNEVLNQIEAQSDYSFLVNQKLVDLNRRVDAVYVNTSIKDILEGVFKSEKVKIVVSDKQIILSPFQADNDKKSQQTHRITGKVTDARTHESLPGVTIQVKGTTYGTTTSIDGTYTLELPSPDAVLLFSFVGYKSEEITTGNQSVINVELTESSTAIEGVVVTALGIKREEKALGFAVQKVDGKTLQTVKVVDPATSLTGKVAGLSVMNSTNFGTGSSIKLRGEEPLIVIDGLPTTNITLNDIAQDDIKNIDVLKGATASALYGIKAANGAIMITTNRGKAQEKGMEVTFNSSTLLNAGYLVEPDVQSSYSSGFNGKYGDDYIWGDKLDIGRTARLWDPQLMEFVDDSPLTSKGKDNLKNFQQQGFITNNNISVLSQGEFSNFRSSITHIFNKGQFPNQKLDKIIYTLGGEIRYKNLTLESNFSYGKHISPNIRGSQYSGGYLYNLIGWLGAEWDVREYKNYWKVRDVEQNFFNMDWYDNPYFLANEVLQSSDRDLTNGFISASYKLNSWLKAVVRTGLDSYLNRYTYRNPLNARNAYSKFGYYGTEKYTGYSVNSDLLLQMEKKFGDLNVDALAGGTIAYQKDDYFSASTQGGLSIPGYYSLKSSKDPIDWESWVHPRQINSLYSRATFAYKSLAYLDATGRWDWSSTLDGKQNPYFYPSLGGSFVISELLPKLTWLDMWKVRSSWTITKSIPAIYDINSSYETYNEVWGGYNSAVFPTSLKSNDIHPQTKSSIEIGTALILYKNRLRIDLTAYNQRIFDFLAYADISNASGFYSKYVNTEEEHTKKGIEIMLGGTPISTTDWKLDMNFNWSKDFTVYSKIDEQYTEDKAWIKEGERVDAYTVYDWERDGAGNIIHLNGFPVRSDYETVWGFSNPDWIWGFNSNLQYKSFSFNFSVDGRVGGMSFSRLDALLWNSGAHTGTDNQYRYDEVVNGLQNYIGSGVKVVSGSVTYDSYGNITSDDRVYAPNDVEVSYENYIKDNYQRGAWSWCSQNILDETFIKLREVSFSYQLPKNLSEKLKMKDTSVSLVGQNVLFWAKEYKISDPDFSEDWDLVSPSIRYFGINIKFTI
jgi:TonB-linked SusC/RagA family outer membrane protein